MIVAYVNLPPVFVYASDWSFQKWKIHWTTRRETCSPRAYLVETYSTIRSLTCTINEIATSPWLLCCASLMLWYSSALNPYTCIWNTKWKRNVRTRESGRIGILVGRVVITPTNFARTTNWQESRPLCGPTIPRAHTENACHGIVLSKLHAPLRFAAASASAAVAFEWINRRKISKGFSHPSPLTAPPPPTLILRIARINPMCTSTALRAFAHATIVSLRLTLVRAECTRPFIFDVYVRPTHFPSESRILTTVWEISFFWQFSGISCSLALSFWETSNTLGRFEILRNISGIFLWESASVRAMRSNVSWILGFF